MDYEDWYLINKSCRTLPVQPRDDEGLPIKDDADRDDAYLYRITCSSCGDEGTWYGFDPSDYKEFAITEALVEGIAELDEQQRQWAAQACFFVAEWRLFKGKCYCRACKDMYLAGKQRDLFR